MTLRSFPWAEKGKIDELTFLNLKFPQKLWHILHAGAHNAIKWSESGESIVVDYRSLKQHYMLQPNRYFKTMNISSFVRQLNLYGFRKINFKKRDNFIESQVNIYKHNSFKRDREDLLGFVSRKKKPSANNSHKRNANNRQITEIKTGPNKLTKLHRRLDEILEAQMQQFIHKKRAEEKEERANESKMELTFKSPTKDSISDECWDDIFYTKGGWDIDVVQSSCSILECDFNQGIFDEGYLTRVHEDKNVSADECVKTEDEEAVRNLVKEEDASKENWRLIKGDWSKLQVLNTSEILEAINVIPKLD